MQRINTWNIKHPLLLHHGSILQFHVCPRKRGLRVLCLWEDGDTMCHPRKGRSICIRQAMTCQAPVTCRMPSDLRSFAASHSRFGSCPNSKNQSFVPKTAPKTSTASGAMSLSFRLNTSNSALPANRWTTLLDGRADLAKASRRPHQLRCWLLQGMNHRDVA